MFESRTGWQRIWRGAFRVTGALIVHCENVGIMYNLTSFIVIVQQTIKKPLVTELLPRSSYTRGWRCKRNYVQFLYIGQVNLNNYAIASINQDGDRRWFLKKTIIIHNRTPLISLLRQCGISLFASSIRLKKWLLAGLAARCDKERRKPGIGSTWLSLISLSNCIFRWISGVGSALSAKPLCWGGGYCTPPQFLSGERIA